MKYVMKAGTLYDRNQKKVFASMRREFAGRERRILSADGRLVLHTDVRRLDTEAGNAGDVRFLEFVLEDEEGHPYATARPEYAEGEEPEQGGWPVCRMPRVDHASLRMAGRKYDLIMKNNENYVLSEDSGRAILQIIHKGLTGGWDIEAADRLLPETVCGLFAFCRYMEQENEFVMV